MFSDSCKTTSKTKEATSYTDYCIYSNYINQWLKRILGSTNKTQGGGFLKVRIRVGCLSVIGLELYPIEHKPISYTVCFPIVWL